MICGYHGWHDWYIGTTKRIRRAGGVQEADRTFPYNDADALERLLKEEPERNCRDHSGAEGRPSPLPGFLERVRELATRYGARADLRRDHHRLPAAYRRRAGALRRDAGSGVLRQGHGQRHADLRGRRPRRHHGKMEEIFFSTTFGGEALSLAASLATIDKLERDDVVTRLWRRGEATSRCRQCHARATRPRRIRFVRRRGLVASYQDRKGAGRFQFADQPAEAGIQCEWASAGGKLQPVACP